MKRLRWVVISSLLAFAVAGTAIAAKEAGEDKAAADTKADTKKGKAGAAEKPSGLPPGVTLNACGCYAKGSGCVCTNKKAKCECPGECEPAGCEDKRNKELTKQYEDEVRRAQDENKKREEAERKKIQDEEKKRQAAEAAEEKRRQEKEAAASAPDDTTAEAAAPAEDEKPAAKTKKSKKK